MPTSKKPKRPKPSAKPAPRPAAAAAARGKPAKQRPPAPAPAASRPARNGRARRPAPAAPPPPVVATPAAPPPPVVVASEPPSLDPAIAATIGTPESLFAARVPSELPERPLPARRRAIFVDVENTSRAVHIASALRDLAINHADAVTDLVASGNWRVIGSETARMLAVQGAQLMHSAPATGVRDWSDLRIAVAAGVWLASARAGDRLEIVSDDRAFDAVGDVAAARGVEFHRWSYRTSGGAAAANRNVIRETAAAPSGARSGRGPRGRSRPAPVAAAPLAARSVSEQQPVAAAPPPPKPHAHPRRAAHAKPPAAPPPPPAQPGDASPGRAAPEESILQVTRELLVRSPRGVNVDAIAQRLKSLGFDRPPGSPRLVTRLRGIKELAVSDNGMVRLASGSPATAPVPAPVEQPTAQGNTEAPDAVASETPPPEAAGKPSGSRRRGRRR